MVKIKSLGYKELEDFVLGLGEKKFRAKQIFEWMHKGVRSFEEMKKKIKTLKRFMKDYILKSADTCKKLPSF